jgi:hypothetical protein
LPQALRETCRHGRQMRRECGIVRPDENGAYLRLNAGHHVLRAPRNPTVPAHHITEEELEQLSNFAEVGMAGLGFAYHPQPLAYRFYANETA